MSQASGLGSEAGNKPLSSHMLDSITPDSVTPQSGSPNSETGYSPYSQPFAQRPTSLTSAGAAVRQSASSLPTPPPFTPGAESQSAGRVPPVAFADYSAGSCDSKDLNTDTPEVSSAWAGSSTRPASMHTESFAFKPPEPPAASSPDVEQFNAATPNVNPQHPLPDLLGQAVHNMTASADTDTRSERSEAASQSSTTSRSSRRSTGQSPGDLLRQARVIFEKRVAVEGSSRIRHNRKNTFKTPLDKGVPSAVTPHNTPMDVATEQHEDQSSPHKSHSTGGKASAPGTPGSVTGPTQASKGASPQSPEDRIMVTNTKAQSPPDSNVSVVSIGSVCPTAGEVGRKLDFSSIASEITAMPAMLAAQGVPDASDVLEDSNGLRGPMPLHKLIDSMQDTVTKQDCEELLGEFLNQPALELDIPRTSAPSTDAPDLAREFMGPVQPPRRPRGWLSRAGTGLLLSLALLGICTAGMLAAEVLHSNMLSTPGVACTPENRVACLAAREAYFQEAGKDLNYPATMKMVKQLKWYMADLWDATFNRRFPEGVDTADIIREYASRYSDDKLQAMTVSQARHIFGPLGAEFMPPIIAAKLAAAGGDTAAAQQPPEDLIAVSAAPSAVPAKQQQFVSVTETEPPAAEQHMSSDVTGESEQLATAAEATAPEVAEAAAAVETATDAQKQSAIVEVAVEEPPTVDEAEIESAKTEGTVPESAVTEVQEEVPAAEAMPSELQRSAADGDCSEEPSEQPVVEATPEQQKPEQLQQPIAFEEDQAPDGAGFEQPEEFVQQQDAAPESAADEAWTLAPAADSAATAAPAFEEQTAAAEEEPAAAAEEQEVVVEPSQADMQHHAVTKARGFWSYLPYPIAALAALLVPAAAYFASSFAQKIGEPDIDTAEADGEADDIDVYDHAAAAQQAAALDEDGAEQAAAEAAVDQAFRDDGGGGLLSDEEYEPPVRTPHRRHSAAALLDAAIAAGTSTLEAVRSTQVLRLKTYKPTRQDMIAGIAEHRAQVDGEAAAPAAAGTVDLDEQLTPTAATRRTAAARTPRAAASGRTTSARSRSTAAAAAHDDGEEVQQPAPRSTGGRPRRTTRGRTSVLPEVPEDQPAADEPLLSDDEPAAAAAPSGRAGRQRQSAPAASADTEARGTSGRGRRRTIGAAAAGADAVTTPRSTRRSSRHSQS